MSKRWLTAHWPHPVLTAHDVPWDVYLKDEHKDLAAEASPGDLVLFYEVGNVAGVRAADPNRLDVYTIDEIERAAGERRDPTPEAREVLYGLGGQTRYVAEVAEPPEDGELPLARPAEARTFVYPRQSPADAATWKWHLPCTNHRRMPRVTIQDIKAKLGVKKNPNLWNGLIEVEDVEAFDALVEKHAKDFD